MNAQETKFEKATSRKPPRRLDEMTQEVIEKMLVGYLVGDPATDTPATERAAERVLDSGIRGKWFEGDVLGEAFERMLAHYKSHRAKSTPEEAKVYYQNENKNPEEAAGFAKLLCECHAHALIRKIEADAIIHRFKDKYFRGKADSIYQEYVQGRAIKPHREALDAFRRKCAGELADPEGSVIREHDWVAEYGDVMGWVADMRRNPDKYAGFRCGIKSIDNMTGGFRPGQLTVFAGWHGGFKSTTLLNISYGLWDNGYEVFYLSLEMEPKIVELKLLCRATRSINFKRVYNGLLCRPGDHRRYRELGRKQLRTAAEDEEMSRLAGIVGEVSEGREDTVLFDEAKAKLDAKPNKIIVSNVGQSKKIKLSQVDSWLEEKKSTWKPQVVVLDYLSLVAAEEKQDIRATELGDICKYLRNMGEKRGFAVVTASQYRRSVMERLREVGFDKPENANLQTDDLAESSQIGADAENVFMLIRDKTGGGTRLRVFPVKARYSESDVGGFVLQVNAAVGIVEEKGAMQDIGEAALGQGIEEGFRQAQEPDDPELRDPDRNHDDMNVADHKDHLDFEVDNG